MVPPARYTSPNSQLKSLYLYTFRPLYYLIFNLPVYSLLPLSDCYAPTNSIIPPEKAPCCVSLLLPLLLHIDCFHPGVLMLIAHSPIKVCSMIFPYMPCSSHQFTTSWVRQADVAEEESAETSAREPPAASLALPEAASPPPPPVARKRLGRPCASAVPAESRRSSTASMNGASASAGMAASPETKTPNLRHRKKGKNKR